MLIFYFTSKNYKNKQPPTGNFHFTIFCQEIADRDHLRLDYNGWASCQDVNYKSKNVYSMACQTVKNEISRKMLLGPHRKHPHSNSNSNFGCSYSRYFWKYVVFRHQNWRFTVLARLVLKTFTDFWIVKIGENEIIMVPENFDMETK